MKRAKVLVVDNDQAVLDFMRAKLGKQYDIVATRDPAAVAGLLRDARPDLIVCDVDMPGLDGGDISAALYADDETREIPLLFLTELVSSEDLKVRKGQIGGRPAVSKAAPVAELHAAIEALLRSRA